MAHGGSNHAEPALSAERPSCQSWDAQCFLRALDAAVVALGDHAAHLNALNVFPVADRDTGTNLLLTLQAAYQAARTTADRDLPAVIQAAAHAALRAAHGNSGVILSQLFRALAEMTRDRHELDAVTLACALARADQLARQAILHPVEGTMVTVLRAAAEAAQHAVASAAPLPDVLRAVRDAAIAAVARTPDFLPILRERGVVDSGAQGIAVILDAWTSLATGDPPRVSPQAAELALSVPAGTDTALYCLNALLTTVQQPLDRLRADLARHGDSLELVGDELVVRIHVHTSQPAEVLRILQRSGQLQSVVLDDLGRVTNGLFVAEPRSQALLVLSSAPGIVAFARRSGALASLTESERVEAPSLARQLADLPIERLLIVPGGPTETALAEAVAQQLSRPAIAVLPVPSLAVQFVVLSVLDPAQPFARPTEALTELLATIRWVDLVQSDAAQPWQLVSTGTLTTIDGELPLALLRALDERAAAQAEVCTIVIGNGITGAERLRRSVRTRWPQLEVQLFWGHQTRPTLSIALE